MKQKLSPAQLTVLHASPPELAKIAAETGYDFFSMRQIYMGLPEEPDFDLPKNKILLSETEAVMANTGIRYFSRFFSGFVGTKYNNRSIIRKQANDR